MAEHEGDCVFCGIIAGTEPATIIREWPDALAFVPLGPVVPGGHTLVVPRRHVADAVQDPAVTAATMLRAIELAAGYEASNILTSVGSAATQSVFHLHLHVIRRAAGDQLMVPWGTTGNPQDPHSCKRSAAAEAESARLRGVNLELATDFGRAVKRAAEAERAARLLVVGQDELDRRWAETEAATRAGFEAAADELRGQRDKALARVAELGRPIRNRIEAKVRPAMLLGLQDAELYGEPGAQRIGEWVDWIADTLTEADTPAGPGAGLSNTETDLKEVTQ
jgi:histidine triad (HIT) family protein